MDSRVILDQGGAEQLLGKGDMLYLAPGTSIPQRVHGAFVGDDEVQRVADDWRQRGKADYLEDVTKEEGAVAGMPGMHQMTIKMEKKTSFMMKQLHLSLNQEELLFLLFREDLE